MSHSHRLGSGNPCRGLCSTTPSLALTNQPANLRNHRRNCMDPLVRWVPAVLWEAEPAESAVESAAEWAEVLEMVWVEQWEWSQGELWCSPFPSSNSRTPVGLETKCSPTVRSQLRSRMAAKSLSLTTAIEEVGSGATSSKDSTS